MEDSFEAILEQALKLTQATNLPTNLQGIAFEKAIDHLLRNATSQEAERSGIAPLIMLRSWLTVRSLQLKFLPKSYKSILQLFMRSFPSKRIGDFS
jgi:hypothetical protein